MEGDTAAASISASRLVVWTPEVASHGQAFHRRSEEVRNEPIVQFQLGIPLSSQDRTL